MGTGCLGWARRQCVTRWSVLVLGCIQNLGGNSPTAIGATAQDLKNSFNMTQQQYGIATSVYFAAELNTLPIAPLLETLGPTFVTVLSLVLTVLPHAGLAVLALTPPFYHSQLFVYSLFLVGGVGLAANNAVIFWTSMANFSSEQHGRVVGALNGIGFFGSMLFNVVYTRCLSPHLSEYFWMVCVVTGVTFLAGIVFNIKVESLEDYAPVEYLQVTEDPKGKLDLCEGRGSRVPLWRCPRAVNLLLLSGVSYGVVNAQLLWFSSQVQALGFTDQMPLILSISPFVSALGLIVIGVLSDILLERCPRMGVYLIFSLVMTVVLFFSIFYLDSFAMLVILTCSNGLMVAAVNCLILSELHQECGEESFTTAMGLFYLTGTTFIFICQYVASMFYDKELQRQGNPSDRCYGNKCFQDFSIVQTCLLGLCVVLNICYLNRPCNRTVKS